MKTLFVLLGFALSARAALTDSMFPTDLHTIPAHIQYLLPMMPPPQMWDDPTRGANSSARTPRLGFAQSFGRVDRRGPIPDDDEIDCDIKVLERCQQSFAKDLGTTIEIFNDLDQFSQKIAQVYTVPISQALLRLCKTQNNFRVCLEDDYFACTSPFGIFESQKKKFLEAFLLAGLYDDIEFDCSGGLTQGFANWRCINTVNNDAQYIPKMQACWNAYVPDLNDTTKYSQSAQTLGQCITDAYKSINPCVTNDVAWWACERAVRRSKEEGFCQMNTCGAIFNSPDLAVQAEPASAKFRQSAPVSTHKAASAAVGAPKPKPNLAKFMRSGGSLSELQLKMYRDAKKHAAKRERRAAREAAASGHSAAEH